MNRKMLRTAVMTTLLVVFGVFVSSCGDTGTSSTTQKSQWNSAEIKVVWMPSNEVNAKCQSLGVKDTNNAAACAAVSRSGCTIYAPEPRSFNDKEGLRRFGHEAWHCFGAMHKGAHS